MAPSNTSLFEDSAEALETGILPSQTIRAFIANGKIISPVAVAEKQIQPASIDLRLGGKALEVRASFLPGRQLPIRKKIDDLLIREVDLEPSAVLPRGSVFIVPLIESLDLPARVSAKANPKSTTGRLDIFTRLITEGGREFENVRAGYSGDLYLEVVSRTFPIVVRKGMSLNQLRFIRGNPPASDGRLLRLAESQPLAYEDDENQIDPQIDRGLGVTVDLQGSAPSKIVAYRAKHNAPPVDLANVGFYDVEDFWEIIRSPGRKGMILAPGDFYILGSSERISVPPTHAAEMVPFDPAIGEFRIHYAGFFDPGFGYGVNGTKAVLEVRAHEVPIFLEDNQLVGRLVYHKMAAAPEKIYGPSIGSSYQQQGLTLSKQFKQNLAVEPAPIADAAPTLAPR
jgi:dCTP deaminase